MRFYVGVALVLVSVVVGLLVGRAGRRRHAAYQATQEGRRGHAEDRLAGDPGADRDLQAGRPDGLPHAQIPGHCVCPRGCLHGREGRAPAEDGLGRIRVRGATERAYDRLQPQRDRSGPARDVLRERTGHPVHGSGPVSQSRAIVSLRREALFGRTWSRARVSQGASPRKAQPSSAARWRVCKRYRLYANPVQPTRASPSNGNAGNTPVCQIPLGPTTPRVARTPQ